VALLVSKPRRRSLFPSLKGESSGFSGLDLACTFTSHLEDNVLPLAAKKTKDDDDDDKEEQFLLPLPEVGGESAKGLFKDRDERHLSIT